MKRPFKPQSHQEKTSWEGVNQWYSELTGTKGHYFHQHVIFPNLFKEYPIQPDDAVLDLACGDGVLERQLKEQTKYLGVDVADSLVKTARTKAVLPHHRFESKNVTRPLNLQSVWTKVYCILALQNMKEPEGLFSNIGEALTQNGQAFIVLNHPAFRIPRQSSWGIDEKNKLQYRRINRYLNPLEIPINMNPGQKDTRVTWSYHFPLSHYVKLAKEHNLVVTDLKEWSSDKKSEGRSAKLENRAREEIPMFMCLVLKKA